MPKSISAVKFVEPRKVPLDFLLGNGLECRGPHSLGILIEWKRSIRQPRLVFTQKSPHSLGILIEWKHHET